jgi:hypothetical protein
VWQAFAAAALVEENHMMHGRVKLLSLAVLYLAARAAVEEDDRQAFGVAPVVDVELVAVANIDKKFFVGVLVGCHLFSVQ